MKPGPPQLSLSLQENRKGVLFFLRSRISVVFWGVFGCSVVLVVVIVVVIAFFCCGRTRACGF